MNRLEKPLTPELLKHDLDKNDFYLPTHNREKCSAESRPCVQFRYTALDVSAQGGPEGVTRLLQNSKCAAL